MALAMLSRAPLHSLVRSPLVHSPLLRPAAALAHILHPTSRPPIQSQSHRHATTAPKFRGKKVHNKKGFVRYAPLPPDDRVVLVDKMRKACELLDLPAVMDLYPSLLSTGLLTLQDTRSICQTLHRCVRDLNTEGSRNPQLDALLSFVRTVAVDLRSGALPPHRYAYVHLLGIFKETHHFAEGYELWQWLVDQDDMHVSPQAYGAAIELLTAGNLMPLPALEELYTEGLKRFPGTFAEYHLSSDAVVPNRQQRIAIAGLPMVLLQGILTARISSRNLTKSYLALDTAMRLYPDQTPARFLELFVDQRPLSEAYTAFLVACRAGIRLNDRNLVTLVSRVRTSMKQTRSMKARMMLLRAIANAIYAHLQSGHRLRSMEVGILLLAFGSVLPSKQLGKDFQGEEAEMRNTIVMTAHETLAGFFQSGLTPAAAPFRSLITIAGKLQVPQLLTTVVEDVKTANLDLGHVGLRVALNSAGDLGNATLIEQYWSDIVALETQGTQIKKEDWTALAIACRRAGHAGFLGEQKLKLAHTLNPSTESAIQMHLEKEDRSESPRSRSDIPDMTPAQLTSEMELLKAQLRDIQTVVMSGTPLDHQQSPFYMHLDPNRPPLSSEENLRAVYDEHTIDPYQPPAAGSETEAAVSRTGIPLGELRFRNWVSIIEMMSDGKIYEGARQARVERAIETKLTPKPMPDLWSPNSEGVVQLSKEELQNKVKQLRHIPSSHPELKM